MADPKEMYQCQTANCGCIFDPDKPPRRLNVPKGTRFTELPRDWCCPICGASKESFKPLAGDGSVKRDHS